MSFEMIKTVYFDMDGVLADWVDRFEMCFPVSYEEYNNNPNEFRCLKEDIAHMGSFYSEMNPMQWVEVLREWIERYPNIHFEILTSVGKINSENVIEQKKEWLESLGLGNVPFNYVYSSKEKAQFAYDGAILIDDRVKSLIPFAQAGGIAVDGNEIMNMLYVQDLMENN